MSQIRITHSPEEGTLVDGTSRGDGGAEVLKVHRARWSRNLGCWYFPHSRDRMAQEHRINGLKAALEEAGFTVEVEITNEDFRTVQEREQERIERQEERVNALAQKVARKEEALRVVEERAQSAFEALPPMGEPIKVGHHSERRHRKAIKRAHDLTGKSVEAQRELEQARAQLRSAQSTTGARYSQRTVYNKVQKLAAEKRSLERQRAQREGSPEWVKYYQGQIERVAQELAYWEGVLATHLEGQECFSKENVKPGDYIFSHNRWYEVARANAKTVTVWFDKENKVTHSSRVPYELIEKRRPAGQ